MSSLRPIIATTLAVLCAGIPAARLTAADEGRLTLVGSSVGLGGKCKSGFWQPVRVTLAATGKGGVQGRLEIVVADGDQTPVIYANEQAPEFNVAAGKETTALLYAKSGPVSAPLKIQLRFAGQVVWQQQLSAPNLGATQELVVGIGPAAGLEEAAAAINRRPNAALQVAQVPSAAELPDAWWGYIGVDTVVLTTSDAAFLDAMTDTQRQALIQWVELGGRIVLSVGARGAEITAAGSPWAALIPGPFDEVVPLRERAGLETFTRTELPFDQEFFQRNRPLIARLKEVRGETLFGEGAGSGGRPMAVQSAFGLGQVIFVGLDLDHPSLAAWKGRPRLLAALIQRPSKERGEEHESARGVGHLGYGDLIGQLRFALEQFGGVTLVNFTTVAILTIVYLLLVGPGDYLLLSRLGWPRQVTWLTFPIVTLAATLAFAYLTRQSHGTRVRLNQLEIVDIDVERKLVRGTLWTHLYSPRTTHYDVELKVAAPQELAASPRGWLSWQGLPGDSLGGLGSRQVVLAAAQPYTTRMPGPQPGLIALPAPIASSKCLSGRWWAHSPLVVENHLAVDQFGLLGGDFRQPLAVELSDCLLAQGERMFRLGTLRPGQRVVLDPQRSLNLEWRLTERRVEQTKDISTPWSQTATDVPQIVQMLMFHEAAGGRAYTGLTHRYQPEIDLSEQIRLGQAVLVGRAKEPISRLEQNGQPLAEAGEATTWTWYRVVLPVTQPKTR